VLAVVEKVAERGGMEVALIRFHFEDGTRVKAYPHRTPDGKVQEELLSRRRPTPLHPGLDLWEGGSFFPDSPLTSRRPLHTLQSATECRRGIASGRSSPAPTGHPATVRTLLGA
jgi:hypothetical protein